MGNKVKLKHYIGYSLIWLHSWYDKYIGVKIWYWYNYEFFGIRSKQFWDDFYNRGKRFSNLTKEHKLKKFNGQ